MKTQKNKSRLTIKWPNSEYFSIKELVKNNSGVIEITLRTWLASYIEEGKVAEIGTISGGQGRPQKVYALTPITQDILNKAKADNINPVDNADRLVNVVSVVTPITTVSPSLVS